MREAVTSDDRSRRSPADDPKFLASLSDLDRAVRSDDPPAEPAADSSSPTASASPRSARQPRHLNELFPSTPGETAAFEKLAMPRAASGARRLIPIFDDGREQTPAAENRAPASSPPESRPASQSRPARGFRERRSSDRAHAPYEAFYGMREPPFSLNADPRFIFHGESYDRAAQQVLDAIRQRDGIAVLIGNAGVGKTTLCRVVMELLDHRTLASLVTDPSVTPEALIRNVLVDFGVASTTDVRTGRLSKASRDELKVALRDFLYSLAPIQAFAVIIVDEAQSLSEDQLQEIRAIAETGGDEQLLQIMLVGEPPLLRTLSRPSLRSAFGRVSFRAELGPLPADEVGGYLAHRLMVAGANPQLEFQPRAVERLHELSGGNPRTINILADRALERGQVLKAKTIGAGVVETAAEELDLLPAEPASALRMVATAAVFALLVLVGAAAGAFILRSDVAALIERWQDAPAPPAPPRPDLPPAYQPPAPNGVQ